MHCKTIEKQMSFPHEQIVKEIEEHTPEFNIFEHGWSLRRFVTRIVLWGLLGTVLGGATEKLFVFLQGGDVQNQSKWNCAAFGVLYLLTLSFVFFAVLRGISRRFDDWLFDTIAGFFFSLSFFAAQNILSNNVQCVFR